MSGTEGWVGLNRAFGAGVSVCSSILGRCPQADDERRAFGATTSASSANQENRNPVNLRVLRALEAGRPGGEICFTIGGSRGW